MKMLLIINGILVAMILLKKVPWAIHTYRFRWETTRLFYLTIPKEEQNEAIELLNVNEPYCKFPKKAEIFIHYRPRREEIRVIYRLARNDWQTAHALSQIKSISKLTLLHFFTKCSWFLFYYEETSARREALKNFFKSRA